MLQLLGTLSPRPSAGTLPLDPNEDFHPRTPSCPLQFNLLDPPLLSPILSPPGSLKNVLQFSFLQLPTSSISLSSGQFHPILKQSIVSPLLKKSTLDKDLLSNYRPISNFFVLSKTIERILKSRLTDQWSPLFKLSSTSVEIVITMWYLWLKPVRGTTSPRGKFLVLRWWILVHFQWKRRLQCPERVPLSCGKYYYVQVCAHAAFSNVVFMKFLAYWQGPVD